MNPKPISSVALVLGLAQSLILAAVEFEPPIFLDSPNAESGGGFGINLAAVPDVNGDDKPDVIVGAFAENKSVGRVYLFDGVTRKLLRQIESPDDLASGFFGVTVAGLDDVDGDGSGDVAVALNHWINEVYLFSGATGTLIHRLAGSTFPIAAVPDLTGDGKPDILGRGVGGGELSVMIYDGVTGGSAATLTSPNTESGTGEANGRSIFGDSLSGIPDVNGDGRGEVIAGAALEDLAPTPERSTAVVDAGVAYVFDGATGALLHTLTAPQPRTAGHFGRSVAGLADVNGDGRGDIAVGANGHQSVFIFDGATGKLLHSHREARSLFGWSANAVPDVNGDGSGDVLVSTFGPEGVEQIVSVVDGATGNLLASLMGLVGTAAGLSDVNGDGRAELLIGSSRAKSATGVPNAGRVRVYLSKVTIKPPEPSAMGWKPEGFGLRLSGEIGVKFEVQRSDDLIQWSTIATQTHTSPVTELVDSNASSSSRRFYRTRTAP